MKPPPIPAIKRVCSLHDLVRLLSAVDHARVVMSHRRKKEEEDTNISPAEFSEHVNIFRNGLQELLQQSLEK